MKRTSRAKCLLLPVLAGVLAFGSACSGKPPEILRTSTQRLLVRDLRSGQVSEKLSVFMVGTDADGTEDLATIYVINDDAELFWSVDSKTWSSSSAEGETWIGTNGLSMPSGTALPAGTYRVILEDEGGGTAETTFTMQGGSIDASRVSFPSVTLRDGAVKVTGSYRNPELWVYTADGRYLTRLAAEPGASPITLPALETAYPEMGKTFMFWAYAKDDARGVGLLSGPYPSAGLQEK
jgi:hypothetical protein